MNARENSVQIVHTHKQVTTNQRPLAPPFENAMQNYYFFFVYV